MFHLIGTSAKKAICVIISSIGNFSGKNLIADAFSILLYSQVDYFMTIKVINVFFFVSADINDKTTEELQALKVSKAIRDWRAKVLGGGRIKHDPNAKTLNVYGYSQVTNIIIDIVYKNFYKQKIVYPIPGYTAYKK